MARRPISVERLESRILFAAESPLDQTFNASGILNGISGPLKILPNGQILVDVNGSGTIRRLNPDGSIDPTFNPTGIVDDWKPGVARQPDGKLLVLSQGVLSRYNQDGSIDASFGNDGQVSSFYSNSLFASFVPGDVTVAGDRIILAGLATPATQVPIHGPLVLSPVVAIEGLNLDGTFDRHFGIHFEKNVYAYSNNATRVKVAPDGTIVAVDDGVIARFAPTGGDNSLATGKAQSVAIAAMDMAITSGGKIVLAGVGLVGAALERLNSNLSEDFSFGSVWSGIADLPRAVADQFNYLAVQPDGRVIGSASSSSGGELIRVISGRFLPLTPTISGHVFNDVNGDGKPDEPGIPGIRIYDDVGGSGVFNRFDPIAVTDAQGNFTLAHVPSQGTQILRQLPDPKWFQTSPATGDSVAVPFDQNTGTTQTAVFGDISSSSVGSVSGRVSSGPFGLEGWDVFLDLNHDGVFESGEPSATTDANGNYSITGIAPGTYDLRDDIHYGWQQASPASSTSSGGTGLKQITIVGGRTLTVNFIETRILVGRISGTVFNDTNGNGTFDQGEQGIPYVFVSLSDGQTMYTTETDGSGHYFFEDVPLGTEFVTVVAPAGGIGHVVVATSPASVTVPLRRPRVVSNVNFGLQLR